MTTPTTSPRIHQLPEPCWTVLTADGEGAGYEGTEFHSLTQAEAEKDRAGYTDQETGKNTTVVVQREVACWAATLLCGEPFTYQGDSDEQHFGSEAELLDAAQLQGNLLTENGLTCGDGVNCETCTPVRRRALS